MHPLHHRTGNQRRSDYRKSDLEQGNGTVTELPIPIGRRPIAEPRPLQPADKRS